MLVFIVINLMKNIDIDFLNGSVYLDGQNIDKQIRTSEASMAASKYSGLYEDTWEWEPWSIIFSDI